MYCACCGNEIEDPEISQNWCFRCRNHVSSGHRELTGCWSPLEDRTFLGQTGKDCPYQVPFV